MSLCRYLPIPSDRMGIIWSLLAVKDSIVLEYGPAGTTHFSMGLFGGLGVDFEQRFFTTHLSEDDVVMGAVTRLEESLVELDNFYHPKVIFVVASSVIAVIGTDIKGVCRYMQPEVKAKLIAFDQGGFRGDYSVGLEETYKLLARNLVPKSPQTPKINRYNIIGVSAGSYRASSDVRELQRLMTEAFAMEMGACLCYDTSVEALHRAGEGSINLVLRQEGEEAAKILQSQNNQPYVMGAPYGYRGTMAWLEQISQVLGKPINPAVIQRLKEKSRSLMPMGPMMRMRAPRKAAIYGEYATVVGIGQLLEEQNFKVVHKLSRHSIKGVASAAEDIRYEKDEKEKINSFKDLHKTLVLADEALLKSCDDSNTKVRITNPVLTGANIATHLPFMGEWGADYLQEIIETYLQSI